VRVPDEAASGIAKVTVQMVGWTDGKVQSATVEVPVRD